MRPHGVVGVTVVTHVTHVALAESREWNAGGNVEEFLQHWIQFHGKKMLMIKLLTSVLGKPTQKMHKWKKQSFDAILLIDIFVPT